MIILCGDQHVIGSSRFRLKSFKQNPGFEFHEWKKKWFERKILLRICLVHMKENDKETERRWMESGNEIIKNVSCLVEKKCKESF